VTKRHDVSAPDSGLQATTAEEVPLLSGQGLSKVFTGRPSRSFSLARSRIRAVDEVSVSIGSGKTVGIAGESGSGKTTLARLMVGAIAPDEGVILFRGRDVTTMRGDEKKQYRAAVQAVFQDPRSAINPRLRVASSVAESLRQNRDRRAESLDRKVDELLEAVGLEAGVRDSFPHQLSGGMLQRVAIAQALASDPEIIVLDEPVSALDVSIRAQIMNLLQDLRDEFGVAFFMISHDLATLRYLSDEVGVMYLGQIVEFGPADVIYSNPGHPYTTALLSAAPSLRRDGRGEPPQAIVLSGDLPSPDASTPGCGFRPRCPLWKALDRPAVCGTDDPTLQDLGRGQRVACHFSDRPLRDASPSQAEGIP